MVYQIHELKKKSLFILSLLLCMYYTHVTLLYVVLQRSQDLPICFFFILFFFEN